jgi:hypothetical protein
MCIIVQWLIAKERPPRFLFELFFKGEVDLDQVGQILVQLMVLFLQLVMFVHLLLHLGLVCL